MDLATEMRGNASLMLASGDMEELRTQLRQDGVRLADVEETGDGDLLRFG